MTIKKNHTSECTNKCKDRNITPFRCVECGLWSECTYPDDNSILCCTDKLMADLIAAREAEREAEKEKKMNKAS